MNRLENFVVGVLGAGGIETREEICMSLFQSESSWGFERRAEDAAHLRFVDGHLVSCMSHCTTYRQLHGATIVGGYA